MAAINQLSTISTLSGDTLFPVYDTANGDSRKVSLSTLSTYIASSVTANISGFTTQYSSPSATGFTVPITDNGSSIHLILTPTSGFAAGTITLPSATNSIDGQMVIVNCTQFVTALTIGANGATAVTGAPTTLAANAYFTLKYDKVSSTWYRIG